MLVLDVAFDVVFVLAAVALALVQAPVLPADDPAAARDRYEVLLAQNPADAAAQAGEVSASEQLALNYHAAKNLEEALRALLRAQKLVPNDARLLYDLGVMEEELRLDHDADGTVAHLLQVSPGNPKALYLAARVKLDLGQLPEAERYMRKYLEGRPYDATAHYGLGHILQQAQQPGPAIAEFEKSVALMPVQTESYYQLGQLALEGGMYQDAIDRETHVLARNPHHGGALVVTGTAWFRLKQYDKAAAALGQAVTYSPEYQPGHYFYGLTLARLGKKEQSDAELATATKLADEENRKASQRLRLNPQ